MMANRAGLLSIPKALRRLTKCAILAIPRPPLRLLVFLLFVRGCIFVLFDAYAETLHDANETEYTQNYAESPKTTFIE